MKVLFVDPARYGREDSGHSMVSTTNQPEETTSAPAAASRCHSRVRSFVGATIR